MHRTKGFAHAIEPSLPRALDRHMGSPTASRLAALSAAIRKYGLAGFIVPHADEHQS
jgi:hypothetical protein